MPNQQYYTGAYTGAQIDAGIAAANAAAPQATTYTKPKLTRHFPERQIRLTLRRLPLPAAITI